VGTPRPAGIKREGPSLKNIKEQGHQWTYYTYIIVTAFIINAANLA
jgi:hypothetical protein